MAGLAWLQRRHLLKEERFFNGINPNFKQYLQTFRQQKINDKVLNILLVVAVIGVIGTVAYILVRNKNGKNLPSFMFSISRAKPMITPTILSTVNRARFCSILSTKKLLP
jgi:uncharacterized membrane protein